LARTLTAAKLEREGAVGEGRCRRGARLRPLRAALGLERG